MCVEHVTCISKNNLHFIFGAEELDIRFMSWSNDHKIGDDRKKDKIECDD